ncbi:TolC family protein [Flexithrix dorotheae]|uniref:TolC family protein n=1 Tax=Flexithrix dorotheae TaxID=70993 RepID=UPI00035E6B36|nr:TolC family protein [Flexithrix dorotheae]
MNQKNLVVFLIIAFIGTNSFGQEILSAYINEGLENNPAMNRENFSLQQQVEGIKEAKGMFFPKVDFMANYTVARGGRSIGLPIGDMLNPIYQDLNVLKGSDSYPANLENVNESFLPNNFQETKFRVTQPILDPQIYYNLKIQEEQYNGQLAQKQAYENFLTGEIKIAYFNYLQSLDVLRVYESSKNILEENLRVNEKLVANNKATRDVIYNSQHELDLLENNIVQSMKNLAASKAYFNFLLNRNLAEEIAVDSAIAKVSWEELSYEALEDQALQNRKELQKIESGLRATEQRVKLNQAGNLPKLGVIADVGYQGFGYDFGSDQDFALLQAGLTWNLFSGNLNKARVQKAKIQHDILGKQKEEVQNQIKLETLNAYNDLRAALAYVKANESGLESASQSFRIIRKKYDQQLVSLLEYQDSQYRFTNAQINVSLAKYNYLTKKAILERNIAGEL